MSEESDQVQHKGNAKSKPQLLPNILINHIKVKFVSHKKSFYCLDEVPFVCLAR